MEAYFLIPKLKPFNSNLNNTRLIMLINIIRKMFTRLLNIKLVKMLKCYNILRGLNFAGLLGGLTITPIITLINIFEYVRENLIQYWTFFQNIKKAYNTVSLDSLEMTLKRIKVSKQIINLILSLLKNRKAREIMPNELSDIIEVQDGIDQREVLILLLWRIFYNPLLTHIQENLKLSSTMQVNWVSNLVYPQVKMSLECRIGGLAYMDDTL